MELIISWLIVTLAVIIAAYLLSGVEVSGFVTALIVALILGIVNAVIRPILLFLVIPVNIVTLGLFTFVVDAIIIYVIAAIIPGFKIRNFWWAILFSVILAIITALLDVIF